MTPAPTPPFRNAARTAARIALLSLAAMPLLASAHKGWLAPSKTVLGVGDWVTVDAGAATMPFVRDHNAMRLDRLVITAPDGSQVAPQNAATGKLRSMFDVQLTQPGTWRIAMVNHWITASWKDGGGQPKRWRGTAATFAKEVPAQAAELKVGESVSRLETFATAGSPTDTRLPASGQGLEMQPITSTADLVVGEPARFRFLVEGKPAAGLDVEIIRDGTRYRDVVGEQTLTTDAAGEIRVDWQGPGLHWMSASVRDAQTQVPQAKERRVSYAATVEVMMP